MDGRSDGTRLNCLPPFVGLQAQKFGGVFINARPRAGTRKTSFLYLEEKHFLSRRSLLADINDNHRHTHAAGTEVLYGFFQNDLLCILDKTL